MSDATNDRPMLDRRHAIGALGAGLLTSIAAAQSGMRGGMTADQEDAPSAAGWDTESNTYVLPALRYAYDALEPHIDTETMRIHHSKHHAGYVRGLNKAMDALERLRNGDDSVGSIKHWSRELAFHGCGHMNHVLFWLCMAPPSMGGGGEPSGELRTQIDRDFGSFGKFAGHFKAAAKSVEGSGWAWLAWEPLAERLIVTQSEKQQNHMFTSMRPILGCDVWEHAYYLRYQNRRADYIDAFMKVIHWPSIEVMFRAARV